MCRRHSTDVARPIVAEAAHMWRSKEVDMRRASLCLFAILLASVFVLAQVTLGRIHGIVTDDSGAVLPGVTVRPLQALGFAAAVAEFGMLLRDSPFKGDASYEHVRALAQEHLGPNPNEYRQEFVRLIDAAARLSGSRLTQ